MAAREVGPEEALALGIALEQHEAADLLPRGLALAPSFAGASPLALSLVKRPALDPGALEAALENEANAQALCFQTTPHRNAVKRFLDKQAAGVPVANEAGEIAMSGPRMVEGKVVVVTGAGGGIGRDIALAMAREGAKVVVNDIGASLAGEGKDTGPAEAVVDEIKAFDGQAVANTDSVSDPAAAARIVATAVEAFGRVDVIVNNAGILRDRFFHKMSAEEFDAVIKVHLYGTFYVSRAAAPHFKEQESGRYVHMTSTSGLIGNFGQANYSAAKLGIAALSKSIALDMRKFNVRSNAVAPFAWTRMIDSIPAETPEQQRRLDGLKKLVPEKVAPFVVGLCADQASDVTGQIFAVRNNEIFLFSQPRPVRSAHRGEGWTPESVVATALPMMRAGFASLDRSSDVFTWDPV